MIETLALFMLCVVVAWMLARYGSRNSKNTPAKRRSVPTRKTYKLHSDPDQLVQMNEPTSRLLTYKDELKAYKSRQRLWIRYRDKNSNITERKVEIYNPEDDEVLYTWCCLKKEPRTFARRNIEAWQLLQERYEFDPVVAQYWEEEGTRDISEKLPWRRWLSDQPECIADKYD